MRKTFTVEELETLAALPEGELSVSERRAVSKYRRSHEPVTGKTDKPLPRVQRVDETVPSLMLEPGVPESSLRFISELPEDSLVSHHSQPKWRWQAIALRAHENMWAELTHTDTRKQATYIAASIARGRLVAFAPGGLFDGVARTFPDGSHHVFARYTGGK